MSKKEIMETLLEYFTTLGKVPLRSEYKRLGGDAPVHPRLLKRYFNGKNYHAICKTISRAYPVEWAAIGTKPVEKEKPKPVLEPASEDDLSPLEKLRSVKGESSE
jgi:hypothetical protein